MYWVIQENFFSHVYFSALCGELNKQGIDYSCVKVSARLHKMEPDIERTGDAVVVMGSSTLGHMAKQRKWTPGYFDANLNYQLYLQHYGQHMLNHGAVIVPLDQAQPQWARFFIRPVSDKKSFSGSVMDFSDLHAMQSAAKQGHALLNADDLVVVAPLQDIYAEYRFWVVDGQIVTSSRYKLGQQVMYSSQVDDYIIAYAQERVETWQPDRAFVIDIAATQDGLKVIEMNAINSSAFYAGDVCKLVEAINSMTFCE